MAWFSYSATVVPELSLLRQAPQEPGYVVDFASELDKRCSSSWGLWEGPSLPAAWGMVQISYSLFTLVLWMTLATFSSSPLCCSFSDYVYAARIASNWKQIMSPCQNSLPVNTFWLRCGMITTVHWWLANSESKAYLPVIWHKECKLVTQLCISGWKMLKRLLEQSIWEPASHIREHKGKQTSFGLCSTASSYLATDWPHSSASIRQNHTNACSLREEIVGLMSFYLFSNNI